MKVMTTFLTLLVVVIGLCAAPVKAQDVPPLPHAFYGTVEINGNPAPAGIKVEAIGEGVLTGVEGNPLTTTKPGEYGSADPLESRLIVQGDILEGATITFYVTNADGTATGPTAEWHSGEVTELNLSVTISPEPTPSPPTGDGVSLTYYADMTLFGIEGRFLIRDGEIVRTIEVTSEDGMLTITIPKGTVALGKDGKRLRSLEAAVDVSPPDPPEDAHIIGLAYDFSPDGATFDPGITFTWSYDPDALPEDVAEEDLVLAYYDEDAKEWVEVDCVVDTENNTITASIEHFTTFAIIGTIPPPPLAPAAFSVTNLSVKPLEAQPKEAVTITVFVANIGGTEGSYTVVLKINGVKEAEKRVTVAAGRSQSVSFSVSKEVAGTYNIAVDGLSESFTVVALAPVVVPVPPPPAPPVPAPPPPVPVPAPPPPEVIPPTAINWPVLGGVIAAVIIVALLIFFLIRRR